MKYLISDRYRPASLDQLSHNREAVTFFKQIARRNDIPHLIVEGVRGSGKRLMVELFLREKYGNFKIKSGVIGLTVPGKTDVKEVNMVYSPYHHQFDPTVHNIYDRTLVQCFISEIVQTGLLINIPYRIIVIENADMLSTEAQDSLRRTLETHVNSCRFIFMVNCENRLISPLYSRCITVKVSSPSKPEIMSILKEVCEGEAYTISDSVLSDIIDSAGHNLHKVFRYLTRQMLQAHPDFKKSNVDDVYRYCEKIIETMIRGKTLNDTMDTVRILLYELINFCVSCNTLIPILLEVALDKLPAEMYDVRHNIIAEAVKHDQSIRQSSKDIYHVESFCLQIFKYGHGF